MNITKITHDLTWYAQKRYGNTARVVYSPEHRCFVLHYHEGQAYVGRTFEEGCAWMSRRLMNYMRPRRRAA